MTSENGTTPQTRYIHMDALRGFAVMGILVINILSFSMPEAAIYSPAIFGGTGTSDIATWVASFILFDGKMRGLFSLLFGASMILIINRTEAQGDSSAKVHYNRMFWLGFFGLVHLFFIWIGDILFLYAIMGCFAYLMHHMSAKNLIKWGVGVFLAFTFIFALLYGSLFMLEYYALQPNSSPTQTAKYRDAILDIAPNQALLAQEISLHQSSYLAIVIEKLTEQTYMPLIYIIIGFSETLYFMMIGMALFKNGFITGELPAKTYRNSIIYGLFGGGIIYIIFAALLISSDYNPIIAINIYQPWSAIPRLMMTIGYTALFIVIIQGFRRNNLLIRIAAAGRMAFTNYIITSIIMTSVFYGYGLGLFGELSRVQLIPYIIGMWTLMLIWSKPWLMRFHYGPLEWLWRSLARRQLQAFKR